MASQQATPPVGAGLSTREVAELRADFPTLHQNIGDKPLAYLDNAATAQMPRQVLAAVTGFYERDRSNVHRGVHTLSGRATVAHEEAREKVRRFVNAERADEIAFVRGTTEAVNLVATAYGSRHIGAGDEIVVTTLEHHSNFVPWQALCAQTGAQLRVVPVDDNGDLDLQRYNELLGPRTKLVAVAHVSNAIGTINPVRQIVDAAHAVGAVVMVDGAQGAPHLAVDVRELDCDFYALSGHKMFGPMGIGAIYTRAAVLDTMGPYQTGGGMIQSVQVAKTTYAKRSSMLEAGTPNVVGAIGLGAATDYLRDIGMDRIAAYEMELGRQARAAVAAVPGIRVIGEPKQQAAVTSFVHEMIHPHDLGTILDGEGVAVRAGHHCAQPLMERYGLVATARASFAFYNTLDEVAALVRGLQRAREVFGA